jgi:AraC family transcriptional regulator
MTPRILSSPSRLLIGASLPMSFANYRIGELWRSFMPRRKEITNAVNKDMISMAIYKKDHFTKFSPANEFEKWAALEVSSFDIVPDGMKAFTLPGGLYAVFDYKGLSTDNSIFQYIYSTWLPVSKYTLDDRPHFEVLGEKYRNNDPESEEEIWVPVKEK